MGRTKQTARKTDASPHADKVLSPVPKKKSAKKAEVTGEAKPKVAKVRAPKKDPADPAVPQLFAKSVFETGREATAVSGNMAKHAIDRYHNGNAVYAKDVEKHVLSLRTLLWRKVMLKCRTLLEERRGAKHPQSNTRTHLLLEAFSKLGR